MEKMEIFEDLNVTPEQAKELADYWRVAGNAIGVIDSKGTLTTAQGIWKRPMANSSFKKLKEAFNNSSPCWIIVMNNQIVVNFGKLRYNKECVKKMIHDKEWGVNNSEKGLRLFKEDVCFGKVWYKELDWCLQGITTQKLGLQKSEVVSISPNQENPDSAEWNRLYFVA